MDIDMSDSENIFPSEHHSFMTCDQNILILINLNTSLDEETLFNLLTPCGYVQWCHIVKSAEGPHGYGFVRFEDKDSVSFALQRIPVNIPGVAGVSVFPYLSTMPATTRFIDNGKYYVTGLPEDVTRETILETVSGFGGIYEVQKIHSGCFIVHMLTEWHFHQAFKSIKEKFGEPSGEINATHFDRVLGLEAPVPAITITLRPYNLAPDTTNEDLNEMFKFLGIVRSQVSKDAYGKPKGSGYVYFKKPWDDTPIMNLFDVFSKPNEEFQFVQRAGLTTDLKKFSVKVPETSMFPPFAEPPIQGKYYRLRKDYCRSFGGHMTLYSRESDENSKLMHQFNIHVTNFELKTQSDLREYFEKFGKVTNVSVLKDSKPYAIVGFCDLSKAREAVEETKIRKSKGETKMNAEVMDSYQIYNVDRNFSIRNRVIVNSDYHVWNGLDYPVYKQKYYQVGSNGVVKRFTKASVDLILEEKRKELEAELKNLRNIPPKNITDIQSNNIVVNNSTNLEQVEQAQRQSQIELNKMNERLADCFSNRDVDEVASVLAPLCTMSIEDRTKLIENENAFRLFCLKKMVTYARQKVYIK